MPRSKYGTTIRAVKGTVIVKEGTTDTCAYQVLKGRVKVYTERRDRKFVLARLGPGEFFGELNLISDSARSASVLAEEDCVLRMITRPVFNRLLRRNPKSLVPLIKILFERLRTMNLKYLMALES
jgi:CRP/FNR family cyclic AMP-dependent transcriptional regulator